MRAFLIAWITFLIVFQIVASLLKHFYFIGRWYSLIDMIFVMVVAIYLLVIGSPIIYMLKKLDFHSFIAYLTGGIILYLPILILSVIENNVFGFFRLTLFGNLNVYCFKIHTWKFSIRMTAISR